MFKALSDVSCKRCGVAKFGHGQVLLLKDACLSTWFSHCEEGFQKFQEQSPGAGFGTTRVNAVKCRSYNF